MQKLIAVLALGMAAPMLTAGCAANPDESPAGPVLARLADLDGSMWSEPVNLGAPINTSANEQNATLTNGGLVLYFASNRSGSLGVNDIWVSRRECLDCPWEEPRNLGPNINSALGDGGPSISRDGYLLFFHSARSGTLGLTDLFVSRRSDPENDLGWGPAENLGPLVNTSDAEQSPEFVQNEGGGMLYFQRGAVTTLSADIHRAPMTHGGRVRALPSPVRELNTPSTNDATPSISHDGKELIFWSFPRPDGLGAADLYFSRRQNVNDRWSDPVLLPGVVNTSGEEATPSLSGDGRTLLFFSGRPGGKGAFDIWMSTRHPSHR